MTLLITHNNKTLGTFYTHWSQVVIILFGNFPLKKVISVEIIDFLNCFSKWFHFIADLNANANITKLLTLITGYLPSNFITLIQLQF